jgi:hypothetical protein
MSIVLTAAVSAATEMQLLLLLSEFKAFGFAYAALGFVSQRIMTA